jgi:hypothetical protein
MLGVLNFVQSAQVHIERAESESPDRLAITAAAAAAAAAVSGSYGMRPLEL